MQHKHRAVAATAAFAALTAGCGGTQTRTVAVVPVQQQALSYAPQAYGANGQCYYVDSPAEVTALIAAGLCPGNWVPAPIPIVYEETYWQFYSSRAYYGTYIPAARQNTYVNVTVVKFPAAHPDLSSKEKQAVYKDNTGKLVAATAIPTAKMTFGSNAAKPTFGSVAPPKPSADGAPVQKQTFGGGKTIAPPPKVTAR